MLLVLLSIRTWLVELLNCDNVSLREDFEAILLERVPSPVTDIEILSPGPRYMGGILPIPTPAGCRTLGLAGRYLVVGICS